MSESVAMKAPPPVAAGDSHQQHRTFSSLESINITERNDGDDNDDSSSKATMKSDQPPMKNIAADSLHDSGGSIQLGQTPEIQKSVFGASRPPSSDASSDSLSMIKSPMRKKPKFLVGDNSIGDNSQIWMEINPLTYEGADQAAIDDSDGENAPEDSKMAASNNRNGETMDEDNDDDEEEEDEGGGHRLDRIGNLDEINDANLMQILAQAAAAQGVSLDWILDQARYEEGGDENDEDVEYPFESLPTNLAGVAEFIQSDKCKRILILAGAGMSVSSGIPDFRSSDGLYATLKANTLTASLSQQEAIREDPAFALDQHLFNENPLPLLETKRDFILGTYEQRWKATLAHRFVELLHAKTGKLVRLYTQNIDGLEDQCSQIPEEMVIPVHGSMDRAECSNCQTRSSFADFCHKVRTQIKDISGKDKSAPSLSTPITCTKCGAEAMKPAIVLFRSSLPREFFENVGPDVRNVDLLIVMGTSLKVAPANSLVWRVPKSAMRLLVNRETVGEHLGMDFDNGRRDYFGSGNCDEVLLDLMEHLGWLPELESLLADQKLPESSANLLQERLVKLKGISSGSDHETSGDTIGAANSTKNSPDATVEDDEDCKMPAQETSNV